MSDVGCPLNVKTPEDMLNLWIEYKTNVKANPKKVMDYVGKDAELVYREKERPLTQVGFEAFVYEKHGYHIHQYFTNLNNAYEQFLPICSHIRNQRASDQIDGGMTGIYNASITQRLNGLVEKTDVTSDGKQLPTALKVEIVPPTE